MRSALNVIELSNNIELISFGIQNDDLKRSRSNIVMKSSVKSKLALKEKVRDANRAAHTKVVSC